MRGEIPGEAQPPRLDSLTNMWFKGMKAHDNKTVSMLKLGKPMETKVPWGKRGS